MPNFTKIEVTEYTVKAFKGTYSLRNSLREGKIPNTINVFTVYSNGNGGCGAWPAEDEETSKKVSEIFAQWDTLVTKMKDEGYTLMASCNQDASAYLVPSGGELSYYGHPEGTYRLSDHWSWYSSEKRCTELERVQCPLKGTNSWPRRAPTAPTTPKVAICVARMVDGEYIPVTDVVK